MNGFKLVEFSINMCDWMDMKKILVGDFIGVYLLIPLQCSKGVSRDTFSVPKRMSFFYQLACGQVVMKVVLQGV